MYKISEYPLSTFYAVFKPKRNASNQKILF